MAKKIENKTEKHRYIIVYEYPKDTTLFGGKPTIDLLGRHRIVYSGKFPDDYFIPYLARAVGLNRKRAKNKMYRFLSIGIDCDEARISDEIFDFDELFVRKARNTKKHRDLIGREIRFTLDESVSRAIAELFSSFRVKK